MSTATATHARFDLLNAPTDGGHVLPDAAARSLLRQLATTQLAIPDAEAVAKTWVEIYLKPGEASHLIFTEGTAAPGGEAPFLEGVFRFTERKAPPPYGDGPDIAVALELRGALHSDVLGTFKQRLADAWQMRVSLHVRPHEGLPRHRDVPEDERRPPEEKKAPLKGAVGVRIEEF